MVQFRIQPTSTNVAGAPADGGAATVAAGETAAATGAAAGGAAAAADPSGPPPPPPPVLSPTEYEQFVATIAAAGGRADPSSGIVMGKRKRLPTQKGDPFIIDTRAGPKKKKKPKEQNDPESEFDTVWICSECKEAEYFAFADTGSELMICEGPCRRLFHWPCVGLKELPPDDVPYICPDCKEKRHICSLCNEFGADDLDVFLCSKKTCGLFFHEACLLGVGIEVEDIPAATNAVSDGESSSNGDKFEDAAGSDQPPNQIKFVCPAHCCWTCTQPEEREKETHSKGKGGTKKSRKAKAKAGGTGAFESKTEKLVVVSFGSRFYYAPTSVDLFGRLAYFTPTPLTPLFGFFIFISRRLLKNSAASHVPGRTMSGVSRPRRTSTNWHCSVTSVRTSKSYQT